MHEDSTTPTKVCTRCGVEKPATAEFFHRWHVSKSGLYPQCKQCKLEEAHKRWVAKHPESVTRADFRRRQRELRGIGRKVCTKCLQDFPATTQYFSHHARSVDGLSWQCKRCTRDEGAKWRADNAERLRSEKRKYLREHRSERQNYDLVRDHDMTSDEYDRILAKQGGVCAICGSPHPGGRGRFHVDHVHSASETAHRKKRHRKHSRGDVRGLLCNKCNTGLGLFRDDPDVLRSAAEYVTTWSTTLF